MTLSIYVSIYLDIIEPSIQFPGMEIKNSMHKPKNPNPHPNRYLSMYVPIYLSNANPHPNRVKSSRFAGLHNSNSDSDSISEVIEKEEAKKQKRMNNKRKNHNIISFD
jgi:hypothetical protein